MWFHRDPVHMPSLLERTERRLAYALLGCVGMGVLLALAIVGMWSVARHVPPPPPPIVIDPAGMILYAGPPESYAQQDLWAMTVIQDVMELIRERRGDAVHMQERHAKAKRFLTGAALTQVEGYLEAIKKDPQHATNPARVQIGQFAWQPPAGKDFAVTWVERWTPTYGTEAHILRVSARMSVEWRQHTGPFGQKLIKTGNMNENPHGIYLTSLSWLEEWDDPKTKGRLAVTAPR
jgi:type IV secretory pathway TrbF-like protein